LAGGKKEKVRAVDRAAGEDDFVGLDRRQDAVSEILDAARAPAIENDARREGGGDESQVWPAEGRIEKRIGRTVALAVPDHRLEKAAAILVAVVEVVLQGKAGLLSRFDPQMFRRIMLRHIVDLEFAVGCV
jgi:hypothetical protein